MHLGAGQLVRETQATSPYSSLMGYLQSCNGLQSSVNFCYDIIYFYIQLHIRFIPEINTKWIRLYLQ